MTKSTPGAIAAGNPKTALAGKLILQEGGNAFDAAAAAILASFVVESTLTSAAGGGFLLAHTQDNHNLLFDFFSQTPRQKKPEAEIDFYPINVDFGDATQSFHIGMGSIAVPGNLAGVFQVHQQLGRLPFNIVAQPALDYARNGFTIGYFQGFCIKLLAPILLALPEGREIYAPQGKLLTAGDTCYMKDFANTLEAIADSGIKQFYHRDIAQQIIKDCREKGGYLTTEDLGNYRVITRKPLQINYRGHTLLTNPPPSSGGSLIAFALKLLETIDLSKVELNSLEHRQILAQVMHLTNLARRDGYDRNIYHPQVAENFLALSHLHPYQNQLNQVLNKWGSTTHISVIDREGNAASVTTSNGEGSSYVVPDTGIMLNNMLGEADLNPLGFHNWTPNQRISSMMSPTIVLKGGKPEIVLGSGGSNRIRTAILQVISHLLDFNLPITEAVTNPRVHWEEHVFNLEPPYEADIADKLQLPETTQVICWQEKNMFFGGVHGVFKTNDGWMDGAGDPRREGVAL